MIEGQKALSPTVRFAYVSRRQNTRDQITSVRETKRS